MIIDHAGGLGESVDDYRAAEIEAVFFQVLRQPLAHLGLGRHLLAALEAVYLGLAADMLPDQIVKSVRLFFFNLQP